MRRTFNVAVSLTKNDYAEFELRPPINMVSGDHGTNILKFTVYDKGLPVDLSGNIAKITCETPSGNRQQQDMTISSPQEGKMEVVLDQRFFTEGGTYLAEVQLYDPANLKVRATLPRFTYDVDTSLLEEHRVVANEQFSILQQMVDTVASAEERSIEALDTATRAMNIATQKGDKATEEANRAKNEADRATEEADRAWAADFAKHVTLDSEAQQNFNFIEDKVVQDGLIKNVRIPDKSWYTFNTYIPYTLMANTTLNAVDTGWIFIGDTPAVSGSSVWGIGFSKSSGELLIRRPSNGTTIARTYIHCPSGGNINLAITQCKAGEVLLWLNGQSILVKNDDLTLQEKLVVRATEGWGKIQALHYDRVLTPEEIQHNLSVINNTPSIKELHTTDSTGKTSILKWATDSHHTAMASGRTLEEEYTSLLGRFGKEIDSPDGSAIQVNDGISGKVLKMSIKGQMIKNYIQTNKHTVTTNVTLKAYLLPVEVGKQYTAFVKISKFEMMGENALARLRVHTKNSSGSYQEVEINKTGIFKITVTMVGSDPAPMFPLYVTNCETCNIVVDGYCLIEGDGSNFTESMINMNIGLNSTEAIISNNGQSYPIYEPTIQGKTRILKAPKGTQNWVEIDASEVRDTATYDYKLDSINGNLGSTPSITDYIDRARKVKIVNTKEIAIDGSNATITQHANSNETTTLFDVQFVTDGLSSDNVTLCVSDKFIGKPANTVWHKSTTMTCIGSSPSRLYIRVQGSISLEQFKAQLKSSPVTVRYQLATPQEIPLTEEQIKTYNAYKKVISLGGVGGVYDALEIKDDGSGIYQKNIGSVVLPGAGAVTSAYTNHYRYYWWHQDIDTGTVSSNYPTCTMTQANSLQAGVWYVENASIKNHLYFYVPKSDFATEPTIEQIKAKLIEKNIIASFKLITPIAITIPKELVPAILTNKTNILEVGGAVKAQSFEATVPVDQIATIKAELEAIKAVLNSPSNLSLSAKYVEDEFNKNNKLESEMMN